MLNAVNDRNKTFVNDCVGVLSDEDDADDEEVEDDRQDDEDPRDDPPSFSTRRVVLSLFLLEKNQVERLLKISLEQTDKQTNRMKC